MCDVSTSAEVCHDALVDLAREETFEAPDDLTLGAAVGRTSHNVVDRWLVVPHADDDRPIEGGVSLAVTAPVEAVPPSGPPGRGGDGTRATELRDGGLRANPLGVVAEDNQVLISGMKRDSPGSRRGTRLWGGVSGRYLAVSRVHTARSGACRLIPDDTGGDKG